MIHTVFKFWVWYFEIFWALQTLLLYTIFQQLEVGQHPLRLGWVTRILSGIQFTTHFIDFFAVETKRFVGSSLNVILTRQTCGQRSSIAVESKRGARGNYFPERICYLFPMWKCRGDWDLGLCTFWVLAKREPLRNGNFQKKRVSPAGKIGIWHCAAVFFSQVPNRPRSQSPLHFHMGNK